MYLSHLDSSVYTTAIAYCTGKIGTSTNIPVAYKVPTIAGTIHQLIPGHPDTHTTVTVRTIFQTTSEEDIAQINAVIAKKAFSGTCNAYGRPSCHSKDCYFLKKLHKSLSFLKIDPKWPEANKQSYQKKRQYDKRRNHVRSLQDAYFIPFDEDPDFFLDDVDEDDEVFAVELI
jgi:hypothetical protein